MLKIKETQKLLRLQLHMSQKSLAMLFLIRLERTQAIKTKCLNLYWHQGNIVYSKSYRFIRILCGGITTKKGSETFKFNNGTLSATSCVIQSYHSGIEAYLTSDALPCRYLQFSYASGVKLDELTEFSKTLYYKQSGIDKYYCIKTFDCNKCMVKIAFSSSEEDLNSKLEFLDQKSRFTRKAKQTPLLNIARRLTTL